MAQLRTKKGWVSIFSGPTQHTGSKNPTRHEHVRTSRCKMNPCSEWMEKIHHKSRIWWLPKPLYTRYWHPIKHMISTSDKRLTCLGEVMHSLLFKSNGLKTSVCQVYSQGFLPGNLLSKRISETSLAWMQLVIMPEIVRVGCLQKQPQIGDIHCSHFVWLLKVTKISLRKQSFGSFDFRSHS